MIRKIPHQLFQFVTASLTRRCRYRTDNTRYLDIHFNPKRAFATYSTLEKLQWEELGARVLHEAASLGYFVALPLNSPVLDSSIHTPNRYIEDMIEKNYFVLEKIADIKVVSPSEIMCLRMYLSE